VLIIKSVGLFSLAQRKKTNTKKRKHRPNGLYLLDEPEAQVIRQVAYHKVEHVSVMKSFLESPHRYLRRL
jgi:predicted ATPase